MFKRSLIGTLMLVSAYAFADSNQSMNSSAPSSDTTAASRGVPPKANPPAVGSKQGSNQVFGEQKMTGKSGQVYYTNDQVSHGRNSSPIGSKAGSNQVFGEPKITGRSGAHYYKHDKNMSNGPNKPTQGSRAGSNQVFGEPAITHKTSAAPSGTQ